MLHYNKLLIYVIPVQTLFRQGRIALQANGQILTLVWGFFFLHETESHEGLKSKER